MVIQFLSFQEHNVNLLHIESRSSVRVPGYEFIVEVNIYYNAVCMNESVLTAHYIRSTPKLATLRAL